MTPEDDKPQSPKNFLLLLRYYDSQNIPIHFQLVAAILSSGHKHQLHNSLHAKRARLDLIREDQIM